MKFFFYYWSLFLLIFLTNAHSQQILWDKAVISEIMREYSIMRANDAMKNNQDLLLNYQQLLIEQEISQEAVRSGLTERIDVIHQLQAARRAILVNAMKDDISRQVPMPDMTAMQLYYHKKINKYTLSEAFKLDIFELDNTNTELLRLAEKMITTKFLEKGLLIKTGAKSISKGDENKWFTEKEINKDVYKALKEMKDGETRMFKLRSNTFVFHRIAYRNKTTIPFENVQSDIIMEIKKQKTEDAWEKYIQHIKNRLNQRNR